MRKNGNHKCRWIKPGVEGNKPSDEEVHVFMRKYFDEIKGVMHTLVKVIQGVFAQHNYHFLTLTGELSASFPINDFDIYCLFPDLFSTDMVLQLLQALKQSFAKNHPEVKLCTSQDHKSGWYLSAKLFVSGINCDVNFQFFHVPCPPLVDSRYRLSFNLFPDSGDVTLADTAPTYRADPRVQQYPTRLTYLVKSAVLLTLRELLWSSPLGLTSSPGHIRQCLLKKKGQKLGEFWRVFSAVLDGLIKIGARVYWPRTWATPREAKKKLKNLLANAFGRVVNDRCNIEKSNPKMVDFYRRLKELNLPGKIVGSLISDGLLVPLPSIQCRPADQACCSSLPQLKTLFLCGQGLREKKSLLIVIFFLVSDATNYSAIVEQLLARKLRINGGGLQESPASLSLSLFGLPLDKLDLRSQPLRPLPPTLSLFFFYPFDKHRLRALTNPPGIF